MKYKRPEMVIFDAGRTLIDYVDVDTLRGVRTLMEHVTANPRNLTPEQVDRFTNETFEQFDACRKNLFEVHEQTVLKLVYDLLELKFDCSLADIERIIWYRSSVVEPVPGAAKALEDLKRMGIRSAVISNLDFSGYLLKERLNVLFPGNEFEFVIASSDYGLRKPMGDIFRAGIAKSGLHPEKIWYVGDKVKVDVDGSRAVGMVPVLYKCKRNAYGRLPEDLITLDDLAGLAEIIE